MPDSRTRRGAHPKDADDFSDSKLPLLSRAVDDLCWLLSRGYPDSRSRTLVGDRYALRERQRKAIGRVAVADAARERRAAGRLGAGDLAGERVDVDGYNVLLTVEAALGGGVLLPSRDGTLRDLAAMSRHYKRVEETRAALRMIGDYLQHNGVTEVGWYFDRPISNSGRLRALMLELAASDEFPWVVELVPNPDPVLKESPHVVATADSAILDAGVRWINLAHEVVAPWRSETWWVAL